MMRDRPGSGWIGMAAFALAIAAPIRAQHPPPPASPPTVITAAPPPAPPENPADLEQRIRSLEEMNRRLLDQYQELLDREARAQAAADQRYHGLEQRYAALESRVNTASGTPPASPPTPTPGISAPSLAAPDRAFHFDTADAGAPAEPAFPLRGKFQDGFAFETLDEELLLRLHLLDQTDFKVFDPGNQKPARGGLYIPRVRVYFEGRVTRPFEYEVSIQRSVEGVWDLLDGNLNVLLPDDRFQLQFGRMLVPYSYSWYDHLEQYFIAPERGLFPLNYGLSRSAGIKVHGRLFEDRLQYAAGGFDGHLVGLADDNTTRDAVGYLNYKPFLHSESWPLLRNLNIGCSGFVGQQIAPLEPLPLRTSLQSSENDEAASAASSVFFDLLKSPAGEPLAFYLGDRSAGAIHLAWYRRQLSFESEWQIGHFQAARVGLPYRPIIPVVGYHATVSYFITGEETEGRGTLVPLRPFAPHRGLHGPGAIELFARYSQLDLGQVVFTDGLADPERWTRNAYMTDIGLNWYLNRFVKLYLDWQHTEYGSPVLLNPDSGLFGRNNDLFWLRCQVYY